MKLEELLDIPIYKGAQIVAGKAGLHREVLSVNMMDAPDIIMYLKPNELLITTAFHFKDDLPSLLLLIEEMERHQCSGLGIKTKRFLGSLPPELVERANQLAMPLLELPTEPSLGDLVNKSLSHILDIRTRELHDAMQTHRQFTQKIMQGEGFVKILQYLSTLLHTPAFILDSHFRLLAGQPQLKTLMSDLDQFISLQYQVSLPASAYSCFTLLNAEHTVLTLFPLYSYQQLHYLAVELELLPEDRTTILTIEQAANVIAFDLMKDQALKQNRRRLQNEFFNKFINGSFSNSDEIVSRAGELGLPHNQRYICAVGQLDGWDKPLSYIQYKSDQDHIVDHILSYLRDFPQPMNLFLLDHHYVLLMTFTTEWQAVEPLFLQCLSQLQARIQTHGQASISFGISSYAQQLLHIPVAYKEASEALFFGEMVGRRQFIEMYQPKAVPEILRMIPYTHLQKFYTDTFQMFLDETVKDQHMLLQTLSVYLECHCQLAETAKRLYIHRNTVIYRLEKCEELLGRSLKDPEETLRLRLAFRVKALLPE